MGCCKTEILPVTKIEHPIKGGASKNLHRSFPPNVSQFHRFTRAHTANSTSLDQSQTLDTKFDFFFWTSFILFSLNQLRLHTSNSSQNPCFGFSELSATLLSSRTRFSMLAAFILVALKGWLTRQEKEMQ